MPETDRLMYRVAVLAGGSSSERDVSFESGWNVAKALAEAGYKNVEIVDPAEPGFAALMASHAYDVAFNALHGAGGEDGCIQGFLEYVGIPYTGSGVAASACTMDKAIAKQIYKGAGIPVAEGITIRKGDDLDASAVIDQLGEELFVKPAVNGSSYGISAVHGESELAGAVAYAFNFDDKVLVEERVRGTEVTVGVFGIEPKALPIVEICYGEESKLYDLSIKYKDPKDIHRIPAHIEASVAVRVNELAVKAHTALGCYGISRSDFIIGPHGPVILETNSIPGMTPASLVPDEFRAAGVPFSQACDEMIEMALKRYESKREN